MSTYIEETIFEVGDEVQFRLPEKGDPNKDRLNLYAAATNEFRPLIVIGINPSSTGDHKQRLSLGNSDREPLSVKFGDGFPEPLEVSGYWLSKVL